MVPVFSGRLHTMSVFPSPLQEVSCVPNAEMVALMVAAVTSSSMVPVPVMVASTPVEKDVGDMPVTLPCVEPQSDQVSFRVPASATANTDDARARRDMLEREDDTVLPNVF